MTAQTDVLRMVQERGEVHAHLGDAIGPNEHGHYRRPVNSLEGISAATPSILAALLWDNKFLKLTSRDGRYSVSLTEAGLLALRQSAG